LLQAIADDDVIPFLRIFAPNCAGEPFRALLFTVLIAEIGVLIADIDKLTPLVSMQEIV
jgi:potassium/chloride transporter 4/5/6